MSSHTENYQHLIGKDAEEAVKALKADGIFHWDIEHFFCQSNYILGMEPRIYHQRGLIRAENSKMVQLQVDRETNKVQNVS